MAAALVVGGVVWVATLWLPAGGPPEQWLDRGDQLASITSMALTAAGVVLAYLVWRRPVNPNNGLAKTVAPVQTDRLSVPVTDRAGHQPPGRDSGAAPPALMQLPRDATWFTGRGTELAHLLAKMPDPEQATAVVISAIDGMGGIGKTTVAVRAAHQLAEHYPDGQLFIDLHGFTDTVAPVEPADALDRLLRAVGVPGERIPVGLDDRAALWRSTLAGRRMLILLDNAATEDQVAPLLPGSAGCLVLTTSRRRLAGLGATHTVSLDMLPASDAVTLFDHAAGQPGLAAGSPELVVEAVELCGRLPLAIRIAAARLKAHPAWGIADLIARLRDQEERLAELEAGPQSVTTALALSYRQLTLDQQHMYRLLGLHPGPDIDVYAAAALGDTTLRRAARLLDQLLDAHLLQEPTPGRYVFHDLVRAHAGRIAARDDAESQRRVVLSRLLNHYRHTASLAMDAVQPYERYRRPAVPPSGTPTPSMADPTAAGAWLDIELPNLLAGVQLAAVDGWPEYTLHLSSILHRHLRTRGRYGDAETLHNQALTTARTTGLRAAELDALHGLGWIYLLLGQYERAFDLFSRALEIGRRADHPTSELDSLLGLGQVCQRRGRHEQALNHYQQALEIAQTTGDRNGERDALHGIGWVHQSQDRYEQAIDHYQQALEIAQTIGNRNGELHTLVGIGWVHQSQDRYDQAIDHHQQALEIAQTIGNRNGESGALIGLSHVHLRQGRHEQAIERLEQALAIARTTGERVREMVALIGLSHVHLRQGRHEQAADTYQHIFDIARAIGDRNGQVEAMQGLGRVNHATGHPEQALADHQEALRLATDLAQPKDQARAHDGLAHAYQALHQPEQAREHWQHAVEILTRIGTDRTDDEEANIPTIRSHLTDLDC